MDRRVTSPTCGPPPPCKQVLRRSLVLRWIFTIACVNEIETMNGWSRVNIAQLLRLRVAFYTLPLFCLRKKILRALAELGSDKSWSVRNFCARSSNVI